MILFLCYVCPPLAVLCMGKPFSACLNFFFTMFFWIPGIGHALVCYADYKGDLGVKRITNAVNAPKYLQASREQSMDRVRGRSQKEVVVIYDNPHVGRGGTYFRKK